MTDMGTDHLWRFVDQDGLVMRSEAEKHIESLRREVERLRRLTEADTTSIYWEAAQYRAVLLEIVRMDPVDNALDPQRAARIAQSVLAAVASEGSE